MHTPAYIFTHITSSEYKHNINTRSTCIGGVVVSVLDSIGSNQRLCNCFCLSAKHVALRRKDKDWLSK